jgi:hypothetical protein
VIFYCEQKNNPGAILYIDQSKAFDRVEWQWVEKVLSKFGFGERFRGWIKTLYKKAYSSTAISHRRSQLAEVYDKVPRLDRTCIFSKVNLWLKPLGSTPIYTE